MSNLEKELVLYEIEEPNKAELDQFKKEFLYQKQRMHIARLSRKFIYDLEDCIVFLKRQLDNIQKFTPKEYRSFLHDIEANRHAKNKIVKELQRENSLLIERLAKVNLENNQYKKEITDLQLRCLKLINKEL